MVMSIATYIELVGRSTQGTASKAVTGELQISSPLHRDSGRLASVSQHLRAFSQGRVDACQHDWELVQYFNSGPAGFSAVLLRAKRSDAARGLEQGEFVLVFHGKAEFSSSPAGQVPLRSTLDGWAPEQVADMETWVASLRFSGVIGANPSTTVIGYASGRYLVLSVQAQARVDAEMNPMTALRSHPDEESQADDGRAPSLESQPEESNA